MTSKIVIIMCDTSVLETLQQVFGHTSFREPQETIVRALLDGRDAIVLLPTGAGKSLCYQLPAVLLKGTTIVVSPLLSLMKNQVDELVKRGVAAAYINSSMDGAERNQCFTLFTKSAYKIIYVSPELLATPKFMSLAALVSIPLLVIDEAHCLSQWGHDFRPAYRQIIAFIKSLPQRPIVAAFSGTATPTICADISTQLCLQSPTYFRTTFNRPNLHFTIQECPTNLIRQNLLFRILQLHRGKYGIIYCLTRAETEKITRLLHSFQIRCVSYHAGISHAQREKVQTDFLSGKINLIVATTAFGLGIHKSNVRFIIHCQLPLSLETYYQEMGRAGRDGQIAYCYLLFSERDLATHSAMIATSANSVHTLQLSSIMQHFVLLTSCRTKFILSYFGEQTAAQRCQHCDNCTSEKVKIDQPQRQQFEKLLQRRQAVAKYMDKSAQIILPKSVLYQILIHQPKTKWDFLKIPGIGRGWVDHYFTAFETSQN